MIIEENRRSGLQINQPYVNKNMRNISSKNKTRNSEYSEDLLRREDSMNFQFHNNVRMSNGSRQLIPLLSKNQ